MPTGFATLLDIAKMNGVDGEVGLIDEASKATPEVSGVTMVGTKLVAISGVGDARPISGINYKTLVRVEVPTVDFRNANEGQDSTKGVYENRLVETFFMNPRWDADIMVADAHEDGPAQLIGEMASDNLEGAFQRLGKSFYYGNTAAAFQASAKGFPGLLNVLNASLTVDAGGTTADTGSSVWAVVWGRKAVRWVWGLNAQLRFSDIDIRDAEDAGGKKFSAYHQELIARPGLQVASWKAVGRIKKLTEDVGKGLTDALIAKLLAKFPVGMTPHVLLMTKRSLEQLRASRTATNATGAPAPTPEEAHGIPIAPTESLLDTEPLAL